MCLDLLVSLPLNTLEELLRRITSLSLHIWRHQMPVELLHSHFLAEVVSCLDSRALFTIDVSFIEAIAADISEILFSFL